MKKNRIYIILFLLLAGTAAYLYITNTNGTIKKELSDFAVKDTSSIDKVFMADRQGKTVLLERKDAGNWIVNHHLEARQDAINVMLSTVASMEVRSPVGKNLYNNTMRLLAANAVKVELYSKGQLIKTFYVGHATMDNLGTFMYLEGSSVPFIMYVPGFNGYLTPRFFTNEYSWRRKVLFAYDPATVKSVSVKDPYHPDSSYTVTKESDSTYAFKFINGAGLSSTDLQKLRHFILQFQNIGYEEVDTTLTPFHRDSILKAGPFMHVTVTGTDGKTKSASFYRMPAVESTISPFEQDAAQHPYNIDKLYVMLEGDTNWYVGQYYTLDKLLKTPSYFKPAPAAVK